MTIATTELRPGYTISRLIKGGWQLAGGHGEVSYDAAIADMAAYVDAGITTFDCADIYTGVEEMIGTFLRGASTEVRARVKVHTKFVPDLDILPRIDRAHVARIIDRSRARLGRERLDLVQFHWWDYQMPRAIETALWLAELQREGKIDLIGGTNFDTTHTAALLDAGVRLATMQVQYSLLDDRPSRSLASLCARHNVQLLAYGTVAGGFLSERWLGAAEPREPIPNRSLTKYKLVIDDAGGWDWFQALLRALARVGARHGRGIGTVASRYVLDLPQVAAVIVGVRSRAHLAEHAALFSFALDEADRTEIEAVLRSRRPLEGDVYALERDRAGRHGRIMKYNLGES
jgi:aryl-alcohol dehydrogenase-like predicted oxidoreductase